MHTKMIEEASAEQLKSYLNDEFNRLKSSMPELYRDMECELYHYLYGNHFTKWKYECAVSKLENRDGTVGAHWSVSQIHDVAKQKELSYNGFNEFDFAYVMNMVYSDYYGVVNDSVDTYFKIAKAFIEDKDAPSGKAFLYWKAMH